MDKAVEDMSADAHLSFEEVMEFFENLPKKRVSVGKELKKLEAKKIKAQKHQQNILDIEREIHTQRESLELPVEHLMGFFSSDTALESLEDQLFTYKRAGGKKADSALNRLYGAVLRQTLAEESNDVSNPDVIEQLGGLFASTGEPARNTPYPALLVEYWLNGEITPLSEDAERISAVLDRIQKVDRDDPDTPPSTGQLLEAISRARHQSILLEKRSLIKQVAKELGFEKVQNEGGLCDAISQHLGAVKWQAVSAQFENNVLSLETINTLSKVYEEKKVDLTPAFKQLQSIAQKAPVTQSQSLGASDQLIQAVMMDMKQRDNIMGKQWAQWLDVSDPNISKIRSGKILTSDVFFDKIAEIAVDRGILRQGVLQAMRAEERCVKGHASWQAAESFGPMLGSLIENVGSNPYRAASQCPSPAAFEKMLRQFQAIELERLEAYPDSFQPLLWEKTCEEMGEDGKEEVWRLNHANIDRITQSHSTLYYAHKRNDCPDKTPPAPEIPDEVRLPHHQPEWAKLSEWPKPHQGPQLPRGVVTPEADALEGRLIAQSTSIMMH